MRLAVSNIAWDKQNDRDVLLKLANFDISGIELAPTIIFDNWGITDTKARDYKKMLDGFGFKVPAFQSIFFGKPELQLFDKCCWNALREHINKVANLASIFDAKVLVFGAPKNRIRNNISYVDAEEISVEILSELADICFQFGCCIGLEANPKEYNCDFITNVADVMRIVDIINKPGLKLHFDSGGTYMCGSDVAGTIKKAKNFVHYHISEPLLAPVVENRVNHFDAFRTLKEIGYNKWVSVEMKKPSDQKVLFNSIEFIKNLLQ
ncbi:MAG: sugar phosphate isomerase/epimerase [Endomicrobium sp.]|jgi:sugar phosphate isomerase/epimerase|uniref:sugar phosphate isomerase/epimerase family protein n=1 Tax=Candidatus Endomicrobiellum cubanum TaxID=3242325 RepID=UPI00282D8F51|nr:sugar phosphate isomerase/epimerase [Endomicrobium sp.]